VRTDAQAKAQSGISFLLIDMKSPGTPSGPSRCWMAAMRVNEIWFETCGCRSKIASAMKTRWTYAKFLLGHERTNMRHRRAQTRTRAPQRHPASETKRWPAADRGSAVAAHIAQVEVDLWALEITNSGVLSGERVRVRQT